MIATGRYILKNGIPKTNPFLAVDRMDIAIQNWFYCIIQYLFSFLGGLIGIQILSVLQYLLFSFVCFSLVRREGSTKKEAAAFALFADICMGYIMRAARPAVLTFIWLLLIIYALDEYRKRKSRMIFYILPAAVIFTANVQSSNLIFFLCPIFAFVVAWLIEYKRKDTKKEFYTVRNLHPILFITVISITAAFINPYGIENVLYLFHSLGHVEAPELTAISFDSFDVPFVILPPIVILSILLDMTIMSKRIDYYHVFLLIGFSILAYTCKRNLIFLIPALMPVWKRVCRLFAQLQEKVSEEKQKQIQCIIKYNPFIKVFIMSVFAAFTVMWGLQLEKGIFPSVNINEQIYTMKDTGDILKYFDDNNIDLSLVSVWPGDAALEMFGAKVLLEPRLEVEDSLINHKEDLYTEYTEVLSKYDKEELDEYFKKYRFDYYIAGAGSKIDLYFDMSNKYTRCEKINSVVIYKNR